MSFRVNLALAYTELTEELGRLRELSALQGRILRTLLQEQARSGGELGPGRGGWELGPQGGGRAAVAPVPRPGATVAFLFPAGSCLPALRGELGGRRDNPPPPF